MSWPSSTPKLCTSLLRSESTTSSCCLHSPPAKSSVNCGTDVDSPVQLTTPGNFWKKWRLKWKLNWVKIAKSLIGSWFYSTVTKITGRMIEILNRIIQAIWNGCNRKIRSRTVPFPIIVKSSTVAYIWWFSVDLQLRIDQLTDKSASVTGMSGDPETKSLRSLRSRQFFTEDELLTIDLNTRY